MEQASRSLMTGIIRAFSASSASHFAVTISVVALYCPLLLFSSWSTIAFQVNTGVSYLLDYVEDCYDGGPLCPYQPLTQTLCIYHYH